ncbi:MAG: ABC transporter ATP-binding protein [Spirochaetales bacterium]|nr:ABC transporter ATP-binding protein [Spirochaetales bacterium]
MATIRLIDITKEYSIEEDKEQSRDFISYISHSKKSLDTGEEIPKVSAIKNLSLTIPDGKTMVILGPSGCGKTTLLKVLAGLIPPDSGKITFDDKDMTTIPAGDRKIGMVFQNYALYPHYNSKGNILTYFLFKKKTPELERQAKEKFEQTAQLLGVDIKQLMMKKPGHLSGGQRQRVAMGRCITRDPSLFLLDEPFSNLDQQLRERYRVSLKRLLSKFNVTTVYVTHDQQEALILADLIAIMREGKIAQVGTAQELYKSPKSLFVAEFINFDTETKAVNTIDGESFNEKYRDRTIGIRPEEISVSFEEKPGYLTGEVITCKDLPIKQATILGIMFGDDEIYVRIPMDEKRSVDPGQKVWFTFSRYHIFDKETEEKIETVSNEEGGPQ